MEKEIFDWDEEKNKQNIEKHGITFDEAKLAFIDPNRIILLDIDHSSTKETRYYCIRKIGNKACTVRFTYRGKVIRIFGAGYWRKEKKIYEKQKK